MNIAIVTDSTCDLPKEVVDKYGITVIPLYINFGDRGYLDGVDISRKEFYDWLPDSDPLPTTATPGIDAFLHAYSRLAERGVTSILSIHISESLSAVIEVARAAAAQTTSVPVTVLDSQQLSLGTGFLVQKAAQKSSEGCSMEEILAVLEDQTSRTFVFAALDTLEFLKRSGRMNGVVASLGNILRIKPILKMHKGEPTAERVRTRERAIQRIINLVSDLGPLEKLALVHTNAPLEAQKLYQKAHHLFPKSQELLSVDVTPVLGTHLGPGVVGFTSIKALVQSQA